MTEYIKHWGDTLGKAYKGLTEQERESLELLETQYLRAYTGTQSRLATKNMPYLESILDRESDNLGGILDGMEMVLDSLAGLASAGYQTVLESLISIWDEFSGDMVARAQETLDSAK